MLAGSRQQPTVNSNFQLKTTKQAATSHLDDISLVKQQMIGQTVDAKAQAHMILHILYICI